MKAALAQYLPTLKSIFNCSKCPVTSCNQKKKHGLSIQAPTGKVYGNIPSMEQMATLQSTTWCYNEISVTGEPQ